MSYEFIRPLEVSDREKVARMVAEAWGAAIVVVHGVVFRPETLPGFVAVDEQGEWLGLLTYQLAEGDCEIVTLESLVPGRGIGTQLIEAVKGVAAGCYRLWLITTNDNLNALAFYQKRGFHLCALYPGAVDRSRQLKPQISSLGNNNIPIHDEIELELILTPAKEANANEIYS